jgi:hypothetical protein
VTYTTPEFVVPLRSRVWPTVVFVLLALYAVWFTVVLWGEQQARTDDPAKWAGLSAILYAWIGFALFFLAALYFLMLLIRREVPAKTYVLRTGPSEGQAPAFMTEAGGAEGARTETPPPQS